jgi:flagellar hook-basal body complex protein FliE
MNISSSSMDINQVLNQIRVRSQYMSGLAEQPRADRTDFSALLRETLDGVNNLQSASSALKTAYERGDESIDLPQVMLASQKASLSFEAVAEVRNRVLNAYQEIMNMQV